LMMASRVWSEGRVIFLQFKQSFEAWS
jgi:hypothetical protein